MRYLFDKVHMFSNQVEFKEVVGQWKNIERKILTYFPSEILPYFSFTALVLVFKFGKIEWKQPQWA